MSAVRDDDVRSSCFASLDVLCAKFGEEVPYAGGLDAGFPFRGRRVPFLSRYRGIHRAAAQRGPAALSMNTSSKSPYADEETPEGFLYDYLAGSPDLPDNRALRAAYLTGAPLVYFVGMQPGWYRPLYPVFVTADDVVARRVLVTPGRMVGPLDEQEPSFLDDPIERAYVVRETRTRLHQGRFRARVLPAYRDQCAICRLKQRRLLDAAHIVGDTDPAGVPSVPNGLSLCSIHHRAFDEDLVGISSDYEVRVAPRLREQIDGPMLDVLKQFHGRSIELPARRTQRPDRNLLAVRFARFESAA